MTVEVGTKVSGKVTGITNFGAFVEMEGGTTGLVHISEVSDKYVKDIHDVLKVGDMVTVKVMSVGNDGKIGLSIRKAEDKPEGEHTHSNSHSLSSRPTGGRPSNSRPAGRSNYNSRNGGQNHRGSSEPKKEDFDSLLTGFLKDSEDRLTSLKRNTEGKRGGRGGRRS